MLGFKIIKKEKLHRLFLLINDVEEATLHTLDVLAREKEDNASLREQLKEERHRVNQLQDELATLRNDLSQRLILSRYHAMKTNAHCDKCTEESPYCVKLMFANRTVCAVISDKYQNHKQYSNEHSNNPAQA